MRISLSLLLISPNLLTNLIIYQPSRRLHRLLHLAAYAHSILKKSVLFDSTLGTPYTYRAMLRTL